MDKTEFMNKCKAFIEHEVDKSKAPVIEHFDSLKTRLIDDIHNMVTPLVKSEVKSVVDAMQAAGQLSAVSPDALSFSPATHASLTHLVRDASINNYNTSYAHDAAERSFYISVKHLRSKTTSPICDPTRDAVSRFIHCSRDSISNVSELQPNGKGKPRMLVTFSSPLAAAAATRSLRSSSNNPKAVLDNKRTRMQDSIVNLAIQLQQTARGVCGLPEASFRASFYHTDSIMFKEQPAAPERPYPFIHHFYAGKPPMTGVAFNDVTTTRIKALIPPVRTYTRVPPPAQQHRQQHPQQQAAPPPPPLPQQQQQQHQMPPPRNRAPQSNTQSNSQPPRPLQQQMPPPERAPQFGSTQEKTKWQQQQEQQARRGAQQQQQQQQQQQKQARPTQQQQHNLPPITKTPSKAISQQGSAKRQAVSTPPDTPFSPTVSHTPSGAPILNSSWRSIARNSPSNNNTQQQQQQQQQPPSTARRQLLAADPSTSLGTFGSNSQ